MIRGLKIRRFRFYGTNHYKGNYDDNTILDAAAAEAIFSTWYDEGENYNYDEEPPKKYAGNFIVRHRMFIIIFLVLLVNCHIKYEIS